MAQKLGLMEAGVEESSFPINFDEFEKISWLEIQKPGELTTLKGGQTLGEILSLK